ncbi:hypothetical protein [Pseudofulvibacter geojedonensis]|uniref:Uncharacterized protein n=1 Tax=Pseudofulvibacter geojedonensis TaxID=1123758 RepID=A0ABW3I280_9FLAO
MKKTVLLLMLTLLASTLKAQETEQNKYPDCQVSEGFKEPLREKKIVKWAKKMNKFNEGMFPSLEDIKSHVAIENDCDINEVTLLRLSEQTGNGIYILCVKGKKMKYKRMGTIIQRQGQSPFAEK